MPAGIGYGLSTAPPMPQGATMGAPLPSAPGMGLPPPPGPPGGATGSLPPAAHPGATVQVMMADGAPLQGTIVATDPDLGLIHVQVGPGGAAPMGAPPSTGAGGSLESVLAQLGGGGQF